MNIKIIETDTYQKELRKLAKDIREQIEKKVSHLKDNPQLGKHLKYLDMWELIIGSYRVFYQIQNNKIELLVIVLALDHKKHLDKKYQLITPALIQKAKEYREKKNF